MQGRKTTDLIAALEVERVRRRLDHRAFSTLLGIHESYWHRIRTGERSLNLRVLQIVMQKLPKVTPAVTAFILHQGNDGKNSNSNKAKPTPQATERAQKPHGRGVSL